MNLQKTVSNNLLQQIIYISIELPTKIVVSTMYNITNSIRCYTQFKPMLAAIDYVLFYTSYRLRVLNNYADEFSANTESFIQEIIKFNKNLALCITSTLIKTGKSTKDELNKYSSRNIFIRCYYTPFSIFKNLIKSFNTNFNQESILTSQDVTNLTSEINNYFRFCLNTITAFLLIPVPLVRSSKMISFTSKIRALPENKVNMALRSSFSLIFFAALYYCITYKSDLIDHSITAAAHFVIVTMLTVILTSIIVGPSKGFTKFLFINFTWASLFCWQCSPIIIALS